MQRLHIDGRRGRRHAPRSENSGSSPLQLRLPCRNLIGVDVEMLRQLSYRPGALEGDKRHLRLEGRCVVPARSSVHGLSCSRRLSPLSGRNSTYRPVQICESGSMIPPSDATMQRAASCAVWKTPCRFTSTTRRHSSIVISRKACLTLIPAFANATSSPPNVDSISLNTLFILA